MKLNEDISQWLVGNITFPLSSFLMNRAGVLHSYREMVRLERRPEEAIRETQRRKLRSIVRYAYEHCPFYKERFLAAGIHPGDIQSERDLGRVPILSRKDVVEHCHELVDCRYWDDIAVADQSARGPGQPIPFARFRRHRLVRNTSSGSTGAPVAFYEDGSSTASNWAFELRLRGWFGLRPGVREARMARVSADYVSHGLMHTTRKLLWHQLMLPGVNLADEHYALALEKIQKFRPRVLWGFTSALAGLAGYIQRTGENVEAWRPELVIGWAAPVYDHEEELLKRVFGCAVTNIYGARETGHIAGLCPHRSWHINQEHVLVESNDNDPGAEPGEILVTVLDPSPMPFIRYRLGDLGRPATSDCACGRNLLVLKDFLGRTGEVFVAKNGSMIAPNFWCRFFMVDAQNKAIERFQVIYRQRDLIVIRLVSKQGFSKAAEADMTRTLRKNFSPDINFQFEYVPRIEAQVSGKYQMVINECRAQA